MRRGSSYGKMKLRSITLGILSSLFFSVTFVLNRRMSLSGESWIWSASLRYLFMLPMLFIIVLYRRTFLTMIHEMMRLPWQWLIWSVIGFGLFYIPLCISADFAPSWLIAASWQFTIIAGSLLAPFFYDVDDTTTGVHKVRKKIPLRGLLISGIIFVGILVVELGHATSTSFSDIWMGSLPIIVAAFAYPLGNRKMMEICTGRLDAIERVFGMTIASLPLWIVLSVIGVRVAGWPPVGQVEQTAMIALSSGVIGTVLFFAASDLTKGNMHELAVVEATQSGEVVFTLLLAMLFLSWRLPSLVSLAGIILIVLGMVAHSLWSNSEPGSSNRRATVFKSSDSL